MGQFRFNLQKRLNHSRHGANNGKIKRLQVRDFIAEMLKGYGISHVFYVDAILRKTMVELGGVGYPPCYHPFRKGGGLYGRWLCTRFA